MTSSDLNFSHHFSGAASTGSSHDTGSDVSIEYPDGNVLLRSLSRSYPVISHGEGIYLFDKAGKRYIDASGGAMVTSIGHGQTEVVEAVAAQLSKVAYVNGMQFTSDAMEAVAEKLSKKAPKGLNRVALLSSGSEAVEAAIKFVRQLWVERGQPSKSKFIARTPGYHGNTLFALSASARAHYKTFFGPLLSDVTLIPAPYEYRSLVNDYHRSGSDFYAKCLEDAIIAAGAENVAGFIFEPIIGSSAGGSCPPLSYFDKVKEICKKYNVLMIADEVLCGAGRTGKFFACEHYSIEPDVVLLGKGINGGYCPVSALMVRDEHLREIKNGSGSFMHAQTYLQSPVMAATVLAVLNFMEKHSLVKNSATMGIYLHEQLKQKLLPSRHVGFVAGKGLLAGIEFVADKVTKKPFDRSKKTVEKFVAHAFERGLILWPNSGQADGTHGDLVMIAPPLNIAKEQVDELTELMKSSVKEFFAA